MRVKSALNKMGVRPSKARGQNFLIDTTVLDSIVEFGDPKPEENVIEIGPGLGALTEKLLQIVPALKVIEVESEFCKTLSEKFGKKIQVWNADVRTVDFEPFGKELVVFGNLPYSLSTEIILHLISQRKYVSRGIFLLQKEFAERLGASPGSKAYGSLSVAVQLWCDTRLGVLVSGNSFHPPTEVTSRVIELIFRTEPKVPVDNFEWFEKIVRASFSQRRKKLKNSLLSVGWLDKDKIDRACDEAQIDSDRRAETLSILEFSKLARALY